ncbi:MAG: GNAT family N-acetyltransferase [Phycisphaerales bacterium]|nr:GNAT family N-acetyltransferase [Phycisphaerales bacterium]
MIDHRTGPVMPRLILLAMVPGDAEGFFALNSHPEVMRFTGEPPIGSLDEARRAIERNPDFDPARGGAGFGRWACGLRETGAFIGFCGLKRLDDLGVVDVGSGCCRRTGVGAWRPRRAPRASRTGSRRCACRGSWGWCCRATPRRPGCWRSARCAATASWRTAATRSCPTNRRDGDQGGVRPVAVAQAARKDIGSRSGSGETPRCLRILIVCVRSSAAWSTICARAAGAGSESEGALGQCAVPGSQMVF